MVKLKEIESSLGYRLVTPIADQESFSDAYTGDLLSDVMGNAAEESVLITIQAHKNSVAVASLLGMKAIILCNNREPTSDMVEAAIDESIAIFVTKETQFVVSYKIARLLQVV